MTLMSKCVNLVFILLIKKKPPTGSFNECEGNHLYNLTTVTNQKESISRW